MVVENVTGWNELVQGNIIDSVFTMFDVALVGWFVPLLIITALVILFLKTKNLTLTWVIGLMVSSLYAATRFVNDTSRYILFIILSLVLAGIFFNAILGKKKT